MNETVIPMMSLTFLIVPKSWGSDMQCKIAYMIEWLIQWPKNATAP